MAGDLIYTTIIHEKRKLLKLTLIEYCIADMVDKMSNKPEYPYCKKTQSELAADLEISRRTLVTAMQKMVKLGLLEKKGHGFRSTEKWHEAVHVKNPNSAKIAQFRTQKKVQKLHRKSAKVAQFETEIPISLKNQKKQEKSFGQSLRDELQDRNTAVGDAFFTEYERRKAQGWRGVYGADLVCVSMGKVRLKIHSGGFVDFGDDLRKIVWKKPA